MTEKNLEQKLIEDLEDSGFASEMRVAQIVKQSQFMGGGSTSYFDLDEKKTRTIDAHAILPKGGAGAKVAVFYHLYIEIKKTERPWVVLSNEDPLHLGERDFSQDFAVIHTFDDEQIHDRLRPVFEQHSIANGWYGTGVHEAFQKPNETGRWFSAGATVSKAIYERGRPKEKHSQIVSILHPVVVLNGPLYEARIDDFGEPVVKKIEIAPMLLEYGSAAYENHQYRIDLVTLSAFRRYLDFIEVRADAIVEALKDLQPPDDKAPDRCELTVSE